MSNLTDYAKEELKRIGLVENDWTTKAILDLLELLASQGHSGFSVSYVVNAFHRLAMFKPLSPLTGENDEWNQPSFGDHYQNNRCPIIFKDDNGNAYNSEGKVFTRDGGKTWFTSKDSRVYITFPYVVPDHPEKIYIVEDKEASHEPDIK